MCTFEYVLPRLCGLCCLRLLELPVTVKSLLLPNFLCIGHNIITEMKLVLIELEMMIGLKKKLILKM